jgi:hypothetical protein
VKEDIDGNGKKRTEGMQRYRRRKSRRMSRR